MKKIILALKEFLIIVPKKTIERRYWWLRLRLWSILGALLVAIGMICLKFGN